MTPVSEVNNVLHVGVNALSHERRGRADIHPSLVAPAAHPTTRRIGIVLSEGFSLLRVGAITEVFQLANEHTLAHSLHDMSGVTYDVRMLSPLGGTLQSASSARMLTECFQFEQRNRFDALFLLAGRALDSGLYAQLLAGGSRRSHGDVIGSRNGWAMPAAEKPQETCIVDNGADAVRSALSLVKRDLGNDVAHQISERVLPSAKAKVDLLLRDIGHKTIEEKVRASALWLDENCTRPITVADGVQVAMMSSRSFSRHFKLQLGVTPSEFLLRARLDLVCRMLTETDLPVEKIARRCGIGNGDRLGKIFRKTLRISPTEYRSRSRMPP
ncbi:helix-turn-helix domain-containing protein [Trinickia sp. NRRL B-1857]|uniref:helix-turn-helix domain-containing protein n=1 Tax=Trinickia sp. NRRL B-1857 TaxID=3162879 RepID=UPI003D2C08C8